MGLFSFGIDSIFEKYQIDLLTNAFVYILTKAFINFHLALSILKLKIQRKKTYRTVMLQNQHSCQNPNVGMISFKLRTICFGFGKINFEVVTVSHASYFKSLNN